MDITQDITYRSFKANDALVSSSIVGGGGIGSGIAGSVVDSFDPFDADIVQFMEKRSLEDGMDVGDVYKGSRRVNMAGTLYAASRPALFDALADMTAAFDPVLAQADEPADKGYQPLYFSRPTLRMAEFPSGYVDLRILCLPRRFNAPISSDSSGGDDRKALGIPWTATLVARDPRIYAATEQDYDIYANPSGDFVSRGNYYSPLNMLILVGSAAGTITVSGGTSSFVITVPSSSGNRIIRVKGADKIVTFEESGVEATNIGAIAFAGDTTWAQVQPGTHGYVVSHTGVTIQDGSHMWFWEAYTS